MNSLTLLVLLLSAAAAVTAYDHSFFHRQTRLHEQQGSKCCLPKQWEGRVGTFVMRKRHFKRSIRMADSKVGVDFTNQKSGARSMMFCPVTKKIYTVRSVVDFKAQKAYSIFQGKCKIFNINATFNSTCMPSQMSSLSPYYYGAGSSRLAISPYGFRSSKLEYFVALASANCVPIKGAFRTIGYGRRTSGIGKYQYYNITAGIADKDLYVIPGNCTQAEETTSTIRRMLGPRSMKPLGVELSSVSAEPLSHLHSMLNGNAAAMEGMRTCKWCRWGERRVRHGMRQVRHGWNRVSSTWRRFRMGHD